MTSHPDNNPSGAAPARSDITPSSPGQLDEPTRPDWERFGLVDACGALSHGRYRCTEIAGHDGPHTFYGEPFDDDCPHRICEGDEHGMRCTECGALLTFDETEDRGHDGTGRFGFVPERLYTVRLTGSHIALLLDLANGETDRLLVSSDATDRDVIDALTEIVDRLDEASS